MQAVLWGHDHTELGHVAIQAITDDVACGLTRGQVGKRYHHVDPNEDSVGAVVGSNATLLVVADGHNGSEASGMALATVLEAYGDDPPPADLQDDDLIDMFERVGEAILDRTTELEPPNADSRTTLTVALVADGARWRRVQWASMGDSALIVTAQGAGTLLTEARHHFVGSPMTRTHLASRLQRGSLDLTPDAWVVAVTDGFTNFVGPRNAGRTVAELLRDAPDAVAAVHRLIERAGAMGAGDNVAVAVAGPVATAAPS